MKKGNAFYALATGSVERIEAPKKLTRNMPKFIPVVVLARLAVDIKFQNLGLGVALLKNAIIRTMYIASNGGVKALLVHALSDEAKSFYLHHHFIESPPEPMTLFLSMGNANELQNLPRKEIK